MNWVEENRHLFKPPVSNRYVYDGRDFFVMVIMGPNARNDFHQVDSEEFFYQLKGDIKVRIREGDRIVDHVVREGRHAGLTELGVTRLADHSVRKTRDPAVGCDLDRNSGSAP
jgi:3-hydroxyanthranilate 3,4-dioxygenase